MGLLKRESLALLKERADCRELIASYLDLRRSGSSYQALCPFHEEKTPSFVVQQGHFHCFGCGVHGDAIAFLMQHLSLTFLESVELLADRYGIELERSEGPTTSGPPLQRLREVNEEATSFYQTLLCYSKEGEGALRYLHQRGIDNAFIRHFRLGYAPAEGSALLRFFGAEGVAQELLQEAGLVSRGRDFFVDRILFPICDPMGHPIGFSGRLYHGQGGGGKYINTPENPLFRKGRLLYGLNYSRREIAKGRQAIVVEGQLDTLRLIASGFDRTVSAQGTAFGEEHVKEVLHLGVRRVFLAFDGDLAGRSAALKVGDLFSSRGIEVRILPFGEGMDPDRYLLERGREAFQELLDGALDYLVFAIGEMGREVDLESPAGKTEVARHLTEQMKKWSEPVMVHESLRSLNQLLGLPEGVMGGERLHASSLQRRDPSVRIDPDQVLENDLLGWLIRLGPTEEWIFPLAEGNLSEETFRDPTARRIYQTLMTHWKEHHKGIDLLSLAMELGEEEQKRLEQILERRMNLQRASILFRATLQKALEREWIAAREGIRVKIQRGDLSEGEVWALAKKFDEMGGKRPVIQEENHH